MLRSAAVRYAKDDTPVERFLAFVNFAQHTGLELANTLTQFLESVGIDIATCRGQTYDNALNKSGQYN